MGWLSRALGSIYDFFAGDYIILIGVAAAFAAAALLAHFLRNLLPLEVVVFLALIIGGLVLTLAREKREQSRPVARPGAAERPAEGGAT